jgi:hypothetical protein
MVTNRKCRSYLADRGIHLVRPRSLNVDAVGVPRHDRVRPKGLTGGGVGGADKVLGRLGGGHAQHLPLSRVEGDQHHAVLVCPSAP